MPDEMPIDMGVNGIIIPSANGNIVRKKMRRNAIGNSIDIQIEIHRMAQQILRDENNFTILRAPYLNWPPGRALGVNGMHPTNGTNQQEDEYWMERIDTSRPLWLGDQDSVTCYPEDMIRDLIRELARYWQQMQTRGYAAWDFELYVQHDNSVIILDFDKYARCSDTLSYTMPSRIRLRSEHFFQHICFPPGFAEHVGNPFRAIM
jgi:hypothetical protein